MTLRLTAEADAALTRIAKAQGVSKNEAAIRAIVDHAADIEREELVGAALADTLSRYSSTLKRLGE